MHFSNTLKMSAICEIKSNDNRSWFLAAVLFEMLCAMVCVPAIVEEIRWKTGYATLVTLRRPHLHQREGRCGLFRPACRA